MDLTTREASTAARDIREASTAAPRDEGGTRDLWERFGQVAPPPPRTLVVVKRPQPMRRRDGATKSVSLHPLQARIYCDSYNVGGDGELYLRLVDAVVASPLFKLAMCVLYAFGPEDIKPSSPGNVALREELAKDGSAEAVETTIIVMRGMCIGWGVVEIALSLFGATLLMKVCRYFIPVEY